MGSEGTNPGRGRRTDQLRGCVSRLQRRRQPQNRRSGSWFCNSNMVRTNSHQQVGCLLTYRPCRAHLWPPGWSEWTPWPCPSADPCCRRNGPVWADILAAWRASGRRTWTRPRRRIPRTCWWPRSCQRHPRHRDGRSISNGAATWFATEGMEVQKH